MNTTCLCGVGRAGGGDHFAAGVCRQAYRYAGIAGICGFGGGGVVRFWSGSHWGDFRRLGLPFRLNILLAARNEGLGGALTTFVGAQEPALHELPRCRLSMPLRR